MLRLDILLLTLKLACFLFELFDTLLESIALNQVDIWRFFFDNGLIWRWLGYCKAFWVGSHHVELWWVFIHCCSFRDRFEQFVPFFAGYDRIKLKEVIFSDESSQFLLSLFQCKFVFNLFSDLCYLLYVLFVAFLICDEFRKNLLVLGRFLAAYCFEN